MLIEMNGFSVLLQKKRVKNINLRIRRTGEVQISAPIKTPIDTVYSFLHQKREWIEMHRARLQKVQNETSPSLETGEFINFQGKKYELYLHETLTQQCVELGKNQIQVFLNPHAGQSCKESLLTRWYCMQMEKLLPSLFEKWQSILDVSINKISIKRMTSRWGSCHPIKKHITLNLRLIEKPLICLEYVIVHELVHLFEPSHNKRFHALMNHYLPDWKNIKKQLSE